MPPVEESVNFVLYFYLPITQRFLLWFFFSPDCSTPPDILVPENFFHLKQTLKFFAISFSLSLSKFTKQFVVPVYFRRCPFQILAPRWIQRVQNICINIFSSDAQEQNKAQNLFCIRFREPGRKRSIFWDLKPIILIKKNSLVAFLHEKQFQSWK